MTSHIAQPVALPCGAVLPNRLAKAAMTEGLADAMNRATERHETLYRRWAEGGAGLLITGNVQVDRLHLERPGNIAIDGNGGLDALCRLAKAGTSAGNHLWMQINHPGRQTPSSVNPRPLAPSAIALAAQEAGCGEPQAMTEAQVEDVIARFVHAASVAQNCGFTGVQIHAAHGYLLSQFLSPLSNDRRDSWGGSLENRARILMEIVRGVRQAVGADFPISVKLNSADFQKGGFSDEESMQVVRWLGDEGIDLLEISGGNYEQMCMIGRTDDQMDRAKPLAESTRRREAYFLDYAARVRPLASMPLMITGGFRSRDAMEEGLRAGELDVVGLARPLCVDADICRKLLTGARDRAPSPEDELSIDRAALGPEVDDKTLRTTESWAQVAWSCMQLLRMGNGEDPDLRMSLLEALVGYDANEKAALAALCRS
ncbi:NADH:flavin oxidoreductase/NADH oxidase family protein [Aromatoleum toluclasticum]|uniref:NADH:flavin oxidoreductase/NADH oxidase family protein n=1 Tax=Aromatoleum toluclasticum TaxID=92003 RepID=UPI0004766322|nr:NADH:flavin oxidoreductase/NADH oxidase family protein [Aromatoleum toluclasticum]